MKNGNRADLYDDFVNTPSASERLTIENALSVAASSCVLRETPAECAEAIRRLAVDLRTAWMRAERDKDGSPEGGH